MAKYKIKNANILHDGKIKAIGEIIELDDVQAKKLAKILTHLLWGKKFGRL